MDERNYKTFIGKDGNRYIDSPKILFPASIRKKRWRYPIFNHIKKKPKKTAVRYVSTKQLAKMFGGRVSSVRALLTRHKVAYQVRPTPMQRQGKFWNYDEAKNVLLQIKELADFVPEGYVPMNKATEMLGVVRSFVYKLAARGLVRKHYARLTSTKGKRLRCFYHLGDLEYVKSHVLKDKLKQ